MFNAYEFMFAGESSYQYGLMLYDIGGNGQSEVPFGNKASIVETRTTGRIQPIHYGANYHASPLEFKLVFGADHCLDRFELENVAFWLTGHQDYQWLSIDQPDLNHVLFRCLITELKPISHGWLPVAFEATVRCDCPYAYGYPFRQTYSITDKANVLFRNESSVREYLKPTVTISPVPGTSAVKIVNHSDNDRVFELSNLPASGIEIVVDNSKGIITETRVRAGYNLYSGFNMNFFRLVQGDNLLEVTGTSTIEISGRFLYNVAG